MILEPVLLALLLETLEFPFYDVASRLRTRAPPQPAPGREAHGEQDCERDGSENEKRQKKQDAEEGAEDALKKGHAGMIPRVPM
jgi:hypothetical protein